MKEPDWQKSLMTSQERYDPAMEIETQEDADVYFDRLIEHHLRTSPEPLSREKAEEIERSNLGYHAGYYSHETRERVERLFRCAHPIFGSIAENGPPTMEEAFRAGITMGEKLRRDV